MLSLVQFSAKFSANKIGVFLITQCYDLKFAKNLYFEQKTPIFFAELFGEIYFKNHITGPLSRSILKVVLQNYKNILLSDPLF
jgi:hypothetical protein